MLIGKTHFLFSRIIGADFCSLDFFRLYMHLSCAWMCFNFSESSIRHNYDKSICLKELSDPNNYHEFCRLLARLKSNYQLGELVTVDNYQVGITVVLVIALWCCVTAVYTVH